jgi:hypothetical protein
MLLEDSLGFTLVLCKEKLCRRNCPKAIVLKKEKILTSKERIFNSWTLAFGTCSNGSNPKLRIQP